MKTSVGGEIPQVNASKQIDAQTPADRFPGAPAPHQLFRTILICHRSMKPGREATLAASCPFFSNSSPFYPPWTLAACPPPPGEPRRAFPAPCCLSILVSTTEQFPQPCKGISTPAHHFPAPSCRAFSREKGPVVSRGWARPRARAAARRGSVNSRCAGKKNRLPQPAVKQAQAIQSRQHFCCTIPR